MKIPNATYETFMERAKEVDPDPVVTQYGDISYAVGEYNGEIKDIAEFNHETNLLTLNCA